MKFCEVCAEEISTKDGENRCQGCDETEAVSKTTKARRAKARRERESLMADCGLVKVRGALGGTYWE